MAFATIDMTKGITGTIPVANGGTGIASGTTGQFLKFTGSTTLASAADNGKIGQFVRAQQTTAVTVSTTTYTAINLSVNITPSAASSKIIIMANIKYSMGLATNTDRGFGVRCMRDTTNIGTSATLYDVYHKSTNSDFIDGGRVPFCLFDESANTTSQITYSFKVGAWNSNSVVLHADSNWSEIMCWELLA